MVDYATGFITRKRLGIMKVKVVSVRKMIMDRYFLGLIGALLALCLIGSGCGQKKGNDMAAKMAGMAVNVVAVEAKKQSIEDKISYDEALANFSRSEMQLFTPNKSHPIYWAKTN